MKNFYMGLILSLIFLIGLGYKIVSNEEIVNDVYGEIQTTTTSMSHNYIKDVIGQQQLNELKSLEYRIREYKIAFNPDFYVRDEKGNKKYAVKEKLDRFYFDKKTMNQSINKGSGLYSIYDIKTKKLLYDNSYPVLNKEEYIKMRKIVFGKTRIIGELSDFHAMRYLVGIMEDDVSTDCDFDEAILGDIDKDNVYLRLVARHKSAGNSEAFEYIIDNYYSIGKDTNINNMPYLPFYSSTKFDLKNEDWNDFVKYPLGTDKREWIKIKHIELEPDIILVYGIGAVESEIYTPFKSTISRNRIKERLSEVQMYGVMFPLLSLIIVIFVFIYLLITKKENDSLQAELKELEKKRGL